MMTIEEKRRQLFEDVIGLYLDKSIYICGLFRGQYQVTTMQAAWRGFNAALDALIIQLPKRDTSNIGGHDIEMGPSIEQIQGDIFNIALDECRAAIESTGLGLKVK